MTQYPEAWLCRELGMAVVNISLITDYDAGVHEGTEAVDAPSVLEVFQANAERIQKVVLDLIGRFPADLDALGARAALGADPRRRPRDRRPRTSACSRRGCSAVAAERTAGCRSGSASGRSGPSPAGGSRAPDGSTRPATPGCGRWDHFIGRGDRTVPVVESWTILVDGGRRDVAGDRRAVRR